MRTFTCEPSLEVIGHGVLAFTNNITHDDIEDILADHKLSSVEPDQWYNMNNLLDVLNDIAARGVNMSSNYISMGVKRAETAKMPPNAAEMTYEQFLGNWNNIYQMQHRNGDAGKIELEKMDGGYMVTFDLIYPDDFIYGVAWGMAKRFLPKGTAFVIEYDESITRKDLGGDNTRIRITW